MTIGFLHTADVHVATFGELVEELAPGREVRHLVDDRLLADARAHGLTTELADRVRDRLKTLAEDGAGVIVCTCSTIGAVAEQSSHTLGVPVLRADRPMTEAAVEAGPRVGVLVTSESTLEPTLTLLRESAERAGTTVTPVARSVASAWQYFEAGQSDRYYAEIATVAHSLAPDVDVIMLAQASMAPAAELITGVAVLTSPRSAVAAAIAR